MENPRLFTNVRMPPACFVSTVARRKPLPVADETLRWRGASAPCPDIVDDQIRSWRKKTLLPPDQFYKHLHFEERNVRCKS
ncbi:unnamed protein product [Ixodes pacificus]